MVGWLIYISSHIFPDGSPLGVRFNFVFLSLLTSLIWMILLQKRHFSVSQIGIFMLLMNLNPLLGVGSIMATPDVPLIFFWSAAYFCFDRLFQSSRLEWYVGLGVALGLGFCSKYHIVLFVLAGLVVLTFEKRWRELKPVGVLLTVLTGAIFSLPVLIWNSQNGWSSFLFQLDHGFGEESFEWQWPVNYVLTQIMMMSPFLFYLLVAKVKSGEDRWFSWTQLGFFLTSSFKSVVEGNWPISSHLHILAATLSHLTQKIVRYTVINWIILYSLIGVFLMTDASKKVRKNLVNSAQLGEIYKLVDQYQPLYGPSYQVASLVTWKTQKFVPKLNELSRTDFFDSLPESRPQEKEFYALKNDYSEWPRQYDRYKKIKLQSFDNVGLELYHFIYE